MHKPLHTGEIGCDNVYNDETGLTVSDATARLGVQGFLMGMGFSTEMAPRLAMFLGASVEMWLNIQRDFDAWKATPQTNAKNSTTRACCLNRYVYGLSYQRELYMDGVSIYCFDIF